jgi:hypothetical protein
MSPALAFYGRPKGPPQRRKSLKAMKKELRATQQKMRDLDAQIAAEISERAVELAHHEAGHMVVAMSLGFTPTRLRLGGDELREGGSAGREWYVEKFGNAVGLAKQEFIVAAAGPIAQRRAMPPGACPYDGMRGDFDNMKKYVKEIFAGREDVTEDEIQRETVVLMCLAEDRVTENWPAIACVAAALLERGSLDEAQLRALYEGGKQQEAA